MRWPWNRNIDELRRQTAAAEHTYRQVEALEPQVDAVAHKARQHKQENHVIELLINVARGGHA